MSKPQVIYVRERTFQSYLADFTTFGTICLSFWFNYKFIDGNNWLDALLFICFFIFAIGRSKEISKGLEADLSRSKGESGS